MSTLTRHADRPAPARRRARRQWPIAVLAVATIAVVGYAVSAYLPPDMATSRIPPRNTTHYVLLVAHIATAAVASIAGAAQFWPWLRRRYPVVHRWTGRSYFFLGVFPSAVLAIPVIGYAPFGAANQAALATLDLLWIVTGVAGYRAVRAGRYADHRRWMIRNYALVWGSLASRFFIPVMLLVIMGQQGSVAYRGDATAVTHDISSGSAWLGLVAAGLIAEWHLQRRYGVPAARAANPRRSVTDDVVRTSTQDG